MRIIIDIEGDVINVTTEPLQKVVLATAGLPSGIRRTPPPELVKAAAAVGAQDAGPAPAHLTGPRKTTLQAAGMSKAGAAPSTPRKAAKNTAAKRVAKKKRS